MLDMFKRKNDPEEHNYLYGIPAVTSVGCLLGANMLGLSSVYTMGYLASSLCCIGGLSGLASQSTARVGNALGIMGVSSGVVTASLAMNFPFPVLV